MNNNSRHLLITLRGLNMFNIKCVDCIRSDNEHYFSYINASKIDDILLNDFNINMIVFKSNRSFIYDCILKQLHNLQVDNKIDNLSINLGRHGRTIIEFKFI